MEIKIVYPGILPVCRVYLDNFDIFNIDRIDVSSVLYHYLAPQLSTILNKPKLHISYNTMELTTNFVIPIDIRLSYSDRKNSIIDLYYYELFKVREEFHNYILNTIRFYNG